MDNPSTEPTDQLLQDLASEFESLEQVVDEAEPFLARHIDDPDLVYRIVLLATEAVTNAIEHGNQMDASKRVRAVYTIYPERVVLTVEDEGGGFNPSSIESPLEDANLLVDSGRGLFLMASMADDVRYEDGGRQLTLVFQRTDAG